MPQAAKSYRSSLQREYLVDRGFQLKYALIFGVAGFAVALVGGAILYEVLQSALRDVALPPELWRRLNADVPTMAAAILATALATGTVMGLFALLLTHRVAGPIYVMTRYIAVLAEGHFPKMRKLRHNDELKDLFDLFQKAVEYMRTRDVADAYLIEEALAVLAPGANTPEARAAVDALKALRDRKRALAERADSDGQTLFAAPDAAQIQMHNHTAKNLPS
ncbi:MAG: signal protein [Myxococcaceae bacterium]